jgi:hypothetical protein
VVTTRDADNPLRQGGAPLLAVDLWEHAYYLDYFNQRRHYVENVVRHLLDWDFAAENLRQAPVALDAAPREVGDAAAPEDEPGWEDPRRRGSSEEREGVFEVPIRSAL